jgi:adenylate kinase
MNIVILGAPGSGKGTQSTRIAKKYKLKWLSTGDVLREAVKDNSSDSIKLKNIMNSGSLVPDDLMIAMFSKMIKDILNNSDFKGILLDGFPRTIGQARELDKLLGEVNSKIDLVIEINASEQEVINRISNRFFCANCKHAYNSLYNTTKIDGVCDECGSIEFFTREDDTAEVAQKRYKSYLTDTMPLIDFYNNRSILNSFDGSKSIDEISDKIDLLLNLI